MKRWLGIFVQAAKAVAAFKLRAAFCISSVSLGVAAITVIVAATEGAYQKAFEIVDRFGPDALIIISGSEEQLAIGRREKTLTLDDARALRESFPAAYLVTPIDSVGNVTVAYKSRKHKTRLIGSTSDYGLAWSWPLEEGYEFTDEDVKRRRNVALIGKEIVRELFDHEDPVGKYILVRDIPVLVLGVLEERGMTGAGHNLDDRVVMPLTTVMRKIENEQKYISVIRMRFITPSQLSLYSKEIREFLRKRHRLMRDEPDDFKIISPSEIIKFLVALSGSLIVFLGVTGVLALIVAGFVLANLFMLAVQERTHEIGIRRAVGARRRDILWQFLTESVILTCWGGIGGFVLGFLSSRILLRLASFPIHFSWHAFSIGMLLAVLVGIAFGLRPASQAARVDPVKAIRGF